MGAHLWYLVVLFVFSVLLYPLLRWFRGRGRGALSKLGDLLSLPGAVYALALPAILLVVLFDYDSPVIYHNTGWSILVYLWIECTCSNSMVSRYQSDPHGHAPAQGRLCKPDDKLSDERVGEPSILFLTSSILCARPTSLRLPPSGSACCR